MKNIKHLIIIISLFSIVSCNVENYFSPIVELDIPEEKPRLVLFSTAKTGDTSITVAVTKTRGIVDNSPYYTVKDSFYYTFPNDTTKHWYYNTFENDTVNNVQVEIFKNDVLILTLKETKKGLFSARLPTPLSSGATYKIRVSASGYETIEATQKAPSVIKVDTIILRENIKVNDPNSPTEFITADEFGIKFQDPLNEDNAYFADISYYLKKSNYERTESLYLFSYDVLSYNNFYPDNSFNGKEIFWRQHSRFLLSNYRNNGTGSTQNERLNLVLYNFTKDRFLFEQSVKKYFDAKDNPFSEPVKIYNNVKNGYGLFTLGTASTYTLKLK